MRLLSDDRFLGLWSLWPSILSRCPALGRPIWSKGRGRMVNCVPRLKALRMQTLITTGVFSLNSLSMLMSFLRVSTLMDEKDLFAEMPGKSEFNLFSFCQLFRSIPWISPQFFHPPPCRSTWRRDFFPRLVENSSKVLLSMNLDFSRLMAFGVRVETGRVFLAETLAASLSPPCSAGWPGWPWGWAPPLPKPESHQVWECLSWNGAGTGTSLRWDDFLVVETDGMYRQGWAHPVRSLLLLRVEGVGSSDDDLAGVDATRWL